MDNPRPEKVAVVDEDRDRLTNSQAALLTEYRGITVADMSTLRRSLRAAGGEYKIYKNTLVRFAARDLDLDIEDLLTGTTAIAFVPTDSTGDTVTVAKVLRDFAKTNTNLVVKGGVLGDKLLSAADATALADVAPRDELLSRFAGGLQAPMQNMAGLLQAPLRDFANLLTALIEDKGGVPDDAASTDEAPAETPDAEAPAAADTDADAPAAAADTDAEAPAAADTTDAADDAAPAADAADPAPEAN
jgi:large subunit ribosomal protein L10